MSAPRLADPAPHDHHDDQDAYHHEEQRQHDAGNREREAEGGEHREIGRAGQVHGLAGRRRLGAAGVDVLVLVGHQ